MNPSLRITLAATLVAVLAPQTFAQRGGDGGGRRVDTPRAQPAPAPAPRPAAPAPAPVQRHEPPPTRTYQPAPAPTPPVVRDTPRYQPPPVRDTPRYQPPQVRDTPRYQPPPVHDTPRYQPPQVRDTPRYQPPVSGEGSGRSTFPDRGVATPTPGGGTPVRIHLPGNEGNRGDDAPPAIGAPVRPRTSSGLRPATPPASDRVEGATPSLRDLYRRVDRDASSPRNGTSRDGERAKVEPVLRDTLAGRYRDRLDRDLGRSRGDGDVGAAKPGTPRTGETIRVGGREARPAPELGKVEDKRPAAPVRGERPIAEHRYPTPGRETRTVTPAPARTPPRLHTPGDTTPIAIEPVRRPPVSGSSGGSGPRTGPNLSNRTRGNSALVRNPYGYHYGSSHWSSHRAFLGFSFGRCHPSYRWGFYSYPFYYSCWWPRWSLCSSWSFGWGWGSSCAPVVSSCWWYPSTTYCYTPIRWDNYDDTCWWDSPWSYDVWYASYPRSTVIVHEVESTPEVVSAPAEPAPRVVVREPEVTPAALAEKHVALGDFYFKEARFQEASESYLRALAYAPEDGTIHLVLADALFATGDYHYAAFIIGKAIKLDPELASSNADKRTFYKDVKTFDAQLATLRGYLADKPYDAAAWLVLGYNLRFSANAAEAKKAFERVVEIDPGHEAARVFLAALAPKEIPAESRPTSR